MPRPTTGFFREPGSSLPDFVPALTEHDLAGRLDELAHHARDRERQNAEKALRALSGSDPTLYPLSSTVRPRIMGLLKRHATELAKVRADPGRRFLNAAGIANQEAEIERRFAEEFAALEADLTSKLAKITAGLEAKLGTLRGGGVTDAEMMATHALASRLQHLTPELGLGEIIEFFDQGSPGQLAALLPILESAYRTPGSPWTGRDELRRLVAIGESLTDGGANASIVAARLERAHRLAGEVATFMLLARTDPTTLSAHATGDGDPDRPHGSYALLPEELPPDGSAPEDQPSHGLDMNPKPFRRVSVTAERRAQDAAARGVQE